MNTDEEIYFVLIQISEDNVIEEFEPRINTNGREWYKRKILTTDYTEDTDEERKYIFVLIQIR